MKHRTRTIGLALLLALSGHSILTHAKPRTIKWETELCTMQAQYDDTDVSAAQLKATLSLLRNSSSITGDYDSAHSEAQDRQTFEAFQQKYSNPTLYVTAPAIERVRQNQLASDRFWYELAAVKRRAQLSQNYALLNEFYPERTHACAPIVQALQRTDASKITLATAILTENCNQNNGYPQRCITQSQAQWHDHNAINNELLHYHWHNCANHTQPELSATELKSATKALNAHLKHIKNVSCDEP